MEATVNRQRLYVPAVAGLYEALSPLSFTLIRVALGLILIPHGYEKLFLHTAVGTARHFVHWGWAYPVAWGYFIGVLEFFGGILLALGLWTRPVALAFTIEMAVICFAILWPHWGWTHHGMEYALLMGVVSLAIFLRGGGRYSVDAMIAKEF